MNNIFVIIESHESVPADVSLELLTKGRQLAGELDCKLEALAIGKKLDGIEDTLFSYGADIVHLAEHPQLEHYRSLPYAHICTEVFRQEKPQIALLGATSSGRDLGPRVSSALNSGLTADCTELLIGDHQDKKANKTYTRLLYQIRPAFGGNILATIINPEHRPQMATVREGVMKKEALEQPRKGIIKKVPAEEILEDTDFIVEILERHIEESQIDIKNASIIVSGGYGVGSVENFTLLHDLADTLGGEVGASRAAVDAGFAPKERQVGQTGVTVRPKLYIACGISGQIQHTAGMQDAAMIISINTNPDAPINEIADYVIEGDLNTVIPKMIAAYRKHTK